MLTYLTTEQRNENSKRLDQMPTMEIIQTINNEDKSIAEAVEAVLPNIAAAIDQISKSLMGGGRLFYVGAGTSGRLGILDAVECPPTFMTSPKMVQPIIAGGNGAIYKAVEGAEDDEVQGQKDIKEKNLTDKDVVIGITASGRTPYSIGALKYANEVGAYTVSLTCNNNSLISNFADCSIEVIVGPEVLSGSTRMKAATAHKMILNMISTTTMIKLGKVYENLMVDVRVSNFKLLERAKRILMEITDISYEEATQLIAKANNEVKPAIVMQKSGVSFREAKKRLEESNGYVNIAIDYN
ncbi:N-acetylmuramic acid 6-phosphate etherase [Paucisalibacillus sp. EB02]|uniref:N-acetylmuramic acid 6-phosphate etherase n=1 Tax=Paucisalibacillus sp. EB02 TaxID=1347087 RepID=UPI0004B3C779|nr:N-acetylmuramic acid 6-phosphate etherase [Paucisalibacillus sp. EB02]